LTNRLIRNILSFVSILLVVPWCVSDIQNRDSDSAVRDGDQTELARPSITSGMINMPDDSPDYGNPKIRNYIEDDDMKELHLLRLFVTPEDQAIKALAKKIDRPIDAYQMAVQWIYVSDETLNHADDRWLTPQEFLTETPHYPYNPLKGKEASDCEEKANTLVSLIRAEGIRPEDVRVTVGTIKCNNEETGHVWVELFIDGYWMALDPCSGPYWDDKDDKLVLRQGVSFDYYASHTYPAPQIWAYYNDIYYLDPRAGSGNAPASWRLYVATN